LINCKSVALLLYQKGL